VARSWLAVIVLSVCVSGCLDRTRVNEQCQWRPDSAGALDLTRANEQRHLYDDVELAEELAIRNADAIYKQRFGSYGHGGLIENGRLRERCMASLLSAVAAAHELRVEQVEHARARGYRDPRWDLGVLLSFGCLYGLLAWQIVRALSRRFPPDEGGEGLIASLLVSVPAGLTAFQLFMLWGGAFEAVRLGNGHVSSYRMARNPWPAHSGTLLIAGIMVFLLIAGLHHWRVSRHRRLSAGW
jgi:hypothetical protein